MITQNLTLNLIPSGVPQRINVSQYDKGETVAVTLYNGATPFTLPSGATVYVSGTKADNTGFEYACSTSGGVSFTIKDQMTVFAGEVTCELSIYQGNNRLSTINFILNVEKAALSEDTEISQTDIPIIENIPQYVTQAANSADLAHKWATFGAASEQPSASNNAKYWAQVAQQTEIGQATTVAYSADTAPYSYKRSTHNAVYDKLVGISWVENQLVPKTASTTTRNGVTFTNNNDGSWTLTGTQSNNNAFNNLNYTANVKKFVSGHKYYVDGRNSSNNNKIGVLLTDDVNTISVLGSEKVVEWVDGENATTSWCLLQVSTLSGTNIGTVKMVPQIVDLTLQFGTDIADKIYTMEQATAGSGLAWIRQYGFLTGKYIEHNVGQIKSAIPKWRKVVGFNVWDEQTELGIYSTVSGSKNPATAAIRSVNYIHVFPNTEYCVTKSTRYASGILVFEYDADKNYIGYTTMAARTTITTSANTHYLTLCARTADNITTYNHDICINISGTKNGTYEPYKEVIYPLGSDELRGVPTLSGNNLVADGDVKTSDGVVNRKYWKETFTSCTSVALDSTSGLYYTTFTLAKTSINGADKLLANLPHTYRFPTQATLGSLYVTANGSVLVYFNVDQTKTTKSAADTYFTSYPLDVIYPLATSTTSVSTPFTSPQISLSTEETDTPCGHDSVVVDIPEWMQTEYFDDVRAEASKVDGLERDLSEIGCDKTTAGTYTLSCTVDSSGNKTYSWA